MSTTNLTGSSAAIPIATVDNIYEVKNIIQVPLTGVTNDILQSIPIRAGSLVKEVIMKIEVAGVGSAVALDVGDSGNATGFLSNIDATQAAGTVVPCPLAGTYPAAGGRYFANAGTIDVKLHTITAMTTAPKITLIATMVDLYDPADYNTGVVQGSTV